MASHSYANRGAGRGGRTTRPQQVQAQIIQPPPQQQQRFNPAVAAQMNQMYGQGVFYPGAAGAGLIRGQPVLHPTYQMLPPGMVIGAGGQHGQPMMMFQPQQPIAHSAHMQVPYGVRQQEMSSTPAHTQKYQQQAQQPPQPSTQQPVKAQAAPKRTTKALLIVDPNTNKPLDLGGVASTRSKSPDPASVTSPTQDAKREEFLAKITGKSGGSEDSTQTGPPEHAVNSTVPQPSHAGQQGEVTQQASESLAAKNDSVPFGTLQQVLQPVEQSQPARQTDPAAPAQTVELSKPVEKPTPAVQSQQPTPATIQPPQLAPVIQPAQPAPVVQPTQPTIVSQPPQPAPVSQPPQPAPVTQPPQPAPVTQPPQPAPVTQPPQPAPVTQPPQPAPVTQPAQPAPVTQPVQPTPVTQPEQPTPLTQPAQPAPVTQPAQPAPVTQPAPVEKPAPAKQVQPSAHAQEPSVSDAKLTSQQASAETLFQEPQFGPTKVEEDSVTSTDVKHEEPEVEPELAVRPEKGPEPKPQQEPELKQPKPETAPTSSQPPMEALATKEPSPENVKEAVPIVKPPVMVSGPCIPSTEDWEAEAIDVPKQAPEQKPSEDWVMVEAEETSPVEPRVAGEKEAIVASKSEADEQLTEKAPPPAPPVEQFELHGEQSKVSEAEASSSEGQQPPPGEQKVEATKAEEKRDQPPPTVEEEKEEGEITSDDETENVNVTERGHMEQEAGGRKKYGREYLLSLRHLKECQEPPVDLFLQPGALGLVKRAPGVEIPVPIGGGSYHREDRFPGARDRKNQSRGGGGGGGRKPSQPKVIDMPTHEKVELRKADVAWKRTAEAAKEQTEEEKETQDLYRKFVGILNKLTPQMFQKLAEQAKELMSTTATSQERLSGCIEKIFLKALEEPVFSVAYAKLCLVLAGYKVRVGVNEDGTPKMKSFRALLLTKCQEEFEKDKKDDEELDKLKQAMEEAQTEEEKKQRKEEFGVAEFKARHRSIGNIRFIGELFKLKLLSEAIMHECIQRLLRSTSDGESLECFAKLMSTIGKEMDHDKGKLLMEKYFNRVNHIIEVKKVDSRVRFMLQDLVDLRQNAWVPRKLVATNVPTTIDKIHEQAKKEEEEMQKRIAHQPMMGRPRGDRDGRRGRDDWPSEHSSRPAPPTKIEADRFNRVMTRTAQPARLGPPGGWGSRQRAPSPTKQQQQQQDSQKYPGRNSKGKRDSKPSIVPPPAGQRRSSSQPSEADSRKRLLEEVAKQTGGKLVEKEPPPETVVSDALSDEEVERKSKTIVGELASNEDYKEAQLCVNELRSPGKLYLFVNTVLNHTLEKSSKDRQVAGVLFDQLLREGVLTVEAFMKGLNELLEYSDDYECDVPKFWDYIAELLAPSVAHKGLPLVTLKTAHEGPLESGKIGKLVAKTLNKCSTLKGVTEDQVYSVWSQSGLEWSTHLHVPPEDLGYLLEDHKLTFLTQKLPARQLGGQSQPTSGDPKDWSRLLEEQIGSNETTNDDLFKYIDTKHAKQLRSPQFIYSLSSAFTQAVVRGGGDAAVFNNDLFQKRCAVLKACVGGDTELQLQVIYGIQVTLAQKQHPKDVLSTMFNHLYDKDIVSEDTFYHWEESGEDLEGRGVALMSAGTFLEWLRSTGDGEEEGAGQ